MGETSVLNSPLCFTLCPHPHGPVPPEEDLVSPFLEVREYRHLFELVLRPQRSVQASIVAEPHAQVVVRLAEVEGVDDAVYLDTKLVDAALSRDGCSTIVPEYLGQCPVAKAFKQPTYSSTYRQKNLMVTPRGVD